MRLVLVLANLPLLSVVASEANTGRPPATVSSTSEPDEVFVEAVIVGAGWAGISAAIDLQNSGHSSLLILEANDYVGGRSKSKNSDGTINAPPAELPSNNVPIEMGSEWLYETERGSQYTYLKRRGYLSKVNTDPYSNETLALGKCGVNSLTSFYWQTGSSPGQSQLLNNTEVKSLESDTWQSYNSFKSSCSSSHEQCKQAYFNSRNLSSLQRQYLNLIIDSCGGMDTSARIDELPANKTFTPDYEIENYWYTGYMSPQGVGFGNTAAAVAEQLKDKIRLNSKVVGINTYTVPGKVIVTYEVASSGSQVRVIANSVVVTVSLNVLKSSNINFVPQLPSWKRNLINGMGMGVMNKCVLVWDDESVSHLFPSKKWIELISNQDATSGRWTTFLNPSAQKGKPTLVGWVSGEDAMRMEDQTDDEVKAEMMSNLKLMFPDIPEPDRVVITRWGKEPNVLGAYSHHVVGRDFLDDSSALGNPVGRIIFAGEATAGPWLGTTVGAWLTGQRAAIEMKQYLTADFVMEASSSLATADANYIMPMVAVLILYFWRALI
ncbi:hypothetical protein THAOC_25896 [Thalassiosira oceanica]|uniref:Amine oxidase domain-containing protein n=1 Tax=Thalassiosira oceanica TaxID=159749 RepID=K0S6G3_THAOC|nr:hypothetical protein THAOC_25896 [Thalassiosira oceanica]|eukprot:EJK54472.1 hypothetical protein THAOC_25896 [Thalassiosira oceanica]